jgi:MYXO-CTERM domain-containing protein
VDQEDRRIWIEDLFGTLFGDANLSTDVGFDDFVRLAENFGETGGWAEGDFDGDASVTFGDFVILAENFGVSAAATVPEPAGAGLAAAGLLFLLFRRQRRR